MNPSKSLANGQKSKNKPKKKGQACNVLFLSNTQNITFCTCQNPQSYFLQQEQGNIDLRKQNNAVTVKPSRFFVFSFHSPTLFQVKAHFLFQLLHCWNNTGQVIWKVSASGWISSHGRMANICLLTAAGWIGSFSNDESEGSENVKKSNMLISKTTTLHVQHTFLYIFLPSLHDYGVEIPNFTFYGEREQATTNFSFSFKTWVWSSRNQLHGRVVRSWVKITQG